MTKGAEDSKKDNLKEVPKEIDIIQLFKEWLTPEAMMYLSGRKEPAKVESVKKKVTGLSEASNTTDDTASLTEELEGLNVEETKKVCTFFTFKLHE